MFMQKTRKKKSTMTNREKLDNMDKWELAEWMCEHNTTCFGCPVFERCNGGDFSALVDWIGEEVCDDKS